MRRTITNFRYVDIFGGVLLLLPTVLVAVALIIFNRIWNPGPLIYVQRRIGVMERPFFIYKFRTMIGDNTPGSFASENNCRITALGRLIRYLHFDELPQCLNVLRGDMSLVGPRPEQDIVHMRLISQIACYRARVLVKPGLTSLSQIRYGYETMAHGHQKRLRCDLDWLRGRSFASQLSVLGLTCSYLIKRSIPAACFLPKSWVWPWPWKTKRSRV